MTGWNTSWRPAALAATVSLGLSTPERARAAPRVPAASPPARGRGARYLLKLTSIIAAMCGSLLGQPAPAAAQSDGILSDYTLTAWTEREGLGSPRVTALAQTADRYLWLGTSEGLFRFDGNRFTKWNDVDSAMPSDSVSALCSARDGSLWVGFSDGTIVRMKNRRVTTYDGGHQTVTGGNVLAIIEDRDGTIWAATRAGLLTFERDEWKSVGKERGLPDGAVLTVSEDRTGDFWAASYSGVYRRRRAQATFERVLEASYFSHRVTRDASGAVWITDPLTGFRVLEDAPHSIVAPSEYQALGIQLLPVGDDDGDEDVWVATLGKGLWRVRTEGSRTTVDVLSRREGLLNDSVRCLIEDAEGNIWVGADYGLYRLAPNKLLPLTHLGVVRVVESGNDGSVWVGTTTGLVRFKDDREQVYGRNGKDLPSPFVTAMHRDTRGVLWIATDRGIARFSEERFTRVAIEGIERLNRIYTMSIDANGELWLCDVNQGLFRVDQGKLMPANVGDSLDHRSITYVFGDHQNRLWVTLSGGGIGFITRDGDLAFQALPALGTNSARINGLYEERSGVVWLGTTAGLFRIEGKNVTNISSQHGLPTSSVLAMTASPDGTLWLGTSAGIVRIEASELDAVLQSREHKALYGLWDAYDGAAGMPVWLGGPNAARDRAGRMWFVSANGLSIADPNKLRLTVPPAPVHVESVFVEGHRVEVPGRLNLAPHSSPIQIEYTSPTPTSAHKLRFRYRLSGFDREWTDAGTRREAIYTNLPPGDYRFEVMAVATDGATTTTPTGLDLTVKPAFAQTVPFFMAVMAACGIALWQLWRLRMRYEKRQFAMVINERVRMSREIHDTLLQSLVGVTLQLDVLSSSDEVSEDGRANLLRVRRELEEDIRETRQSIWNLRSSKLAQEDLATILRGAGERLTRDTSVRFNLAVQGTPRRFRRETEQQMLRIGEQAIVNAVRHGSATEVTVTIGFEDDRLHLRVEDNGRGFEPDKPDVSPAHHYGLATMKERAEELGGRLSVITNPGVGTAVEAAVPI